MANAQLERLNRSVLDHRAGKEAILVTEPMQISRKRMAEARVGDWIDLGEEAPDFFVRRGDELLGRVYFLRTGANPRVRFEALGYEPVWERPGKKRVALEGRLAVWRVTEAGEEREFPWPLTEHLHLYTEGSYWATARLIEHDDGYALEIKEMGDE